MKHNIYRTISLTVFCWLWSSLFCLAQGTTSSEEIAPNPNLEVLGIPRIPASLAQQVKRYSGAYGLPLAGWDREKHVPLLKGMSSVAWVSRVNAPGAAPQTWLYLRESNIYDFYWQPQGKYLVYNRDVNGNEAFQMYNYDIEKRTSILLTDGKARSTEPVWSRAGTQIVYSSSPPSNNGVNLNLVSPLDPKSNRLLVTSTGNYLKAADWSPDDASVVYCEFIANTHSRLWLIEMATGKTRLLTPQDEVAYYSEPQFSADGKGIYVITDRDADMRRLVYLDLATKQCRYLMEDARWNVEEFRLSPNGKALAVVMNEAGLSRLSILDLENKRTKTITGIPNGIVSDLHWHSNSVDLAFNFKSSSAPNDVYSVDCNGGMVTQWARSTEAAAGNIAAPEAIQWKSFDGKLITGFLARPPASFRGKRPVIIDLHGGPTEQYRPTYGYEENFLINELGVVKIYPNVRGSSGFGKAFQALDDGLKREDAIKDVGALLDWIKAQPDLDADRVLVQGASYGGYLALSVAAQYSPRLRGVISDSGMTNLATFLARTEGWRRDIQRAEFGDERDAKMKAWLERIAPLHNAQQIKCPVFVVQGQNDPRVPVNEAESLVQALRQKKTPVWYLLGKNEGHGFADAANRDFQLYTSILFVQEYLLR
ncbi:MAG: S9 family peptidase [Acidobacteria bacterium]|nr:S9 family peptidase [Acidobacteriota bacterium]